MQAFLVPAGGLRALWQSPLCVGRREPMHPFILATRDPGVRIADNNARPLLPAGRSPVLAARNICTLACYKPESHFDHVLPLSTPCDSPGRPTDPGRMRWSPCGITSAMTSLDSPSMRRNLYLAPSRHPARAVLYGSCDSLGIFRVGLAIRPRNQITPHLFKALRMCLDSPMVISPLDTPVPVLVKIRRTRDNRRTPVDTAADQSVT